MSTGNPKRQRRRATRVRRPSEPPVDIESSAPEPEPADEAAREHYRREKERRAQRTRPAEHPLEQARRAYQALLAADAERARGGRPKKEGAAAKPKKTDSPAPETDPEE
jgi:hypothetical protein